MDNAFVRELIDAGIHFGHRVGRWNPKMKPYVLCSRNSIHIIDVKETIKGLLRSKKFLTQVVSSGKDVLFVGTKRQARNAIMEESRRCGMPYVAERWLGGTLTNFRTIRSRLQRLEELEAMDANGQLAQQSKKMQSTLRRELGKVKRNLDGIRKMDRMPGALVIIDARREHNAIREARKLNIPTVCLLDTDCDPDLVSLPIPGNDDAMRAIELVIKQLADSVLEGKVTRSETAHAASSEPRTRSRRISIARAVDVMTEEAGSAGDKVADNPIPATSANTPRTDTPSN
ncbi:MAG: 30S ribosomal protein S2 [Sedimentisphaerales bacterium]|nr:30S ribosomal protein S2 [Sedimentisphaerales bacterium]